MNELRERDFGATFELLSHDKVCHPSVCMSGLSGPR